MVGRQGISENLGDFGFNEFLFTKRRFPTLFNVELSMKPRGRGITETNGMGEGLLSLDSHFMNAPTSGVNLA